MRKDDAKPWVRAIGRRWRGRDEFRRRVEFAGGEQREEKEEERRLLRVLKDVDGVAASVASSRARPHARPRVHARENGALNTVSRPTTDDERAGSRKRVGVGETFDARMLT